MLVLQKETSAFRQRPIKELQPSDRIVCVLQREMACVAADSSVKGVGSVDATTCHLVSIRHRVKQVVCLAHIDSERHCVAQFQQMLAALEAAVGEQPCDSLEVCLCGGFVDHPHEEGEGHDKPIGGISRALLTAMHTSPTRFVCRVACIAEANTVRHFRGEPGVCGPAVMGAACDAATGEFYPASFVVPGPPNPNLRLTLTLTLIPPSQAQSGPCVGLAALPVDLSSGI